MDPELASALPSIPNLDLRDIPATRQRFAEAISSLRPRVEGVIVRDRHITGPNGRLRLRVMAPDDGLNGPRPAILNVHGGGFVLGAPELDDALNAWLVRHLGVVVVSPDYRLAPENPFPGALEDGYAALCWLVETASAIRIDPSNIVLMGDSAGGAIAAAISLVARDRGGPLVRFQVLLEPVLDDRLVTPSMQAGDYAPVWDRPTARLSWAAYLGPRVATAYAAPARAEDLTGLPATYLTVNALDPLRDEGLEFAQRLMLDGVEVEVHVWPGAYHGFSLVPSDITRRAKFALRDAIARAVEERIHGPEANV